MIAPKLTPGQRKSIDAYVVARASYSAWQPSLNPHAQAVADGQQLIANLAEKEPAHEELILAGYRFSVPVSAKRIKRTLINIPALFKKLGKAWVEKRCAPSLGDFDKSVEPDERAPFVKEERVLSRIIGEPVQAVPMSKAA
jgi:hypothetical protein